MKVFRSKTAKYIIKNIKRISCYTEEAANVIAPPDEAIDKVADRPHEEVHQEVARPSILQSIAHYSLHYSSCIILSVSQIGQIAVAFFVPGQRGDAAAEVIDRAGQAAAILVHELVDQIEDNNFYDNRALLPRAINHPDIEWWAEHASRNVNYAAALANIATQLIATNRMPITANHLMMATHGLMLVSSGIGYTWSGSTINIIQSISLYNLAHSIASMHIPTAVVGITSNNFWDWISDDVIRVGIYAATDRIENTLDSIYGADEEIAPVIEPYGDDNQDLYPDGHNVFATLGVLILAGLIYTGEGEAACG